MCRRVRPADRIRPTSPPDPCQHRGVGAGGNSFESVELQQACILFEPGLRCRTQQRRAQSLHQIARYARSSNQCGHGRKRGRLDYADPCRELRRIAGQQQVPVGVQRTDVDPAGAHVLQHVARGHQVRDHLAVQHGARRAAKFKQMVPEGIEARVRVSNGESSPMAEGVGQCAERRVLAHNEIGPVDSATAGPPGSGDRSHDRRDRCEFRGDRKAAHEGAAQVRTRPQLFERLRCRVLQILK